MKLFQFEEFQVHQNKATMKIDIDAVLLDIWYPVIKEPKTILDIDSETGIIVLMLTQRTNAVTR